LAFYWRNTENLLADYLTYHRAQAADKKTAQQAERFP